MTTSIASSAKPMVQAPTSSLAALAASSARLMRFLLRNPMTLAGLIVIGTLMIVALFAPWIATHDPLAQDLSAALRMPGAQNWFGTDEYGRDVFSRLVYGSRITLYIVMLVTVIRSEEQHV